MSFVYVKLNFINLTFKTMKKIKLCLAAIFALSFLIYSCENEAIPEEVTALETDVIINTNSTEGRTLVTDDSILNSIRFLDLDVGVVTIGDFHLPDGTIEQKIYIGSDIAISRTELQSLYDAYSDSGRQYRTANLVTGANRTINVLGYTGGSQALSSKARTAMSRAVANYNNISNMTLQFNLSFGTNFQAADMVVFDNSINNGSSGGLAGFPSSNGQPNKFIQIYGLEQFSTNVNEHVITHEMGHSVGFRHTDWFDRLSCPANIQGNEGQGNEGAIYISGTPSGRDLTSVMQACFNTNVSGNFNGNDITSLRSMYPASSGSICNGVSEWQSGVNYPVGARVTYFGDLYERTNRGWRFVGSC